MTKPGWSKPHTHSNPTSLALFRHKITLYRFSQGAHTIAGGGLKWEQGAEPPPLILTTGCAAVTFPTTEHQRTLSVTKLRWLGKVIAGLPESNGSLRHMPSQGRRIVKDTISWSKEYASLCT